MYIATPGFLMLAFMPSIVTSTADGVDLVADHGGDVRRPADQADHLRLDVLLLEEAPLERDEVRQRRADREHADLDLVLRGGRQRGERDGKAREQAAASFVHACSFSILPF